MASSVPVLVRLNSAVERTFLLLVGPVFLVYIGAIFVQVVARNYLAIPIVWLDEVSRMCFLWTIMLGAAIALRRRVHYDIVVIPERFRLATIATRLFAHAVTLAIIGVMIFYGWRFARMGMFSESQALEIPWGYIYVSMPLAGVAMLSFWIEVVIADLRGFRGRGGGGD